MTDQRSSILQGTLDLMVLKTLERLARNGTQLVMAVHERADVPACVRRTLTIGSDRRILVSGKS